MKSPVALVALLLLAAVALSACSDDDEPTRMEMAAEDCKGYVVHVDEFAERRVDTEPPLIIWHPDLQAMQISHADAVNCVFNSLGISDQTRNRINYLSSDDDEVQLYENGLSISGQFRGLPQLMVDVDDEQE